MVRFTDSFGADQTPIAMLVGIGLLSMDDAKRLTIL